MRDDLRLALRVFRHQPGFATLTIIMLALGLGANVALFGVVDGVLLSPLRLHEPEALVQLERVRSGGSASTRFVEDELRTLSDGARSFAGIAGVWDARRLSVFLVGDISEPERVSGALVSLNFFDLLGPSIASRPVGE